MHRIRKKWDNSSLFTKFYVVFFTVLTVTLPAIPLALVSEDRVHPEWSVGQFIVFGVGACIAFALLVAGVGVLCAFLQGNYIPKRLWALTVFALFGWVFLPLMFALWFHGYYTFTESTLQTWSSYAGELQAKVYFDDQKCRLLELEPDAEMEFTGRKEGPFEIWSWSYHSQMSWLHTKEANAQFVDSFNDRMRELWQKKETD